MASTAAEIAPQFYTSNLEEDNNCLSAALIKFKFNMKSQSALDFASWLMALIFVFLAPHLALLSKEVEANLVAYVKKKDKTL